MTNKKKELQVSHYHTNKTNKKKDIKKKKRIENQQQKKSCCNDSVHPGYCFIFIAFKQDASCVNAKWKKKVLVLQQYDTIRRNEEQRWKEKKKEEKKKKERKEEYKRVFAFVCSIFLVNLFAFKQTKIIETNFFFFTFIYLYIIFFLKKKKKKEYIKTRAQTRECWFKFLLHAKCFLQMQHANGFSRVW
ncbi:hypothetical protein RFI_23574, partial [Reticulomyxa filosa]